jgi:hypothetical protein
MYPIMAARLMEQFMQHRRRHHPYRGFLDAGPAGVLWGLLVLVTMIMAIAIFVWLVYALLSLL